MRGPELGGRSAPGVPELAVNLQLNAAHREQEQSRFRSSRPDEVTDPELPVPDPRSFRSCQRIFYTFVIHRESPHTPTELTELGGQSFHLSDSVLRGRLTIKRACDAVIAMREAIPRSAVGWPSRLAGPPTSRGLLLAGSDLECPRRQSLTFLTSPKRTAPRKRNIVAWRRRLIPRVMQCPRQQYVLAALQKVQRLLKKSDAETKRSLPPYLSDGGVVLQIIPRCRRPRLYGPMRRGRFALATRPARRLNRR